MPLPLPQEELPEKVRRFAAPDAPLPAKRMAARGLVPVTGNDLVTLLVQLSADPDAETSRTATDALAGVPEAVLEAACRAPLHPAILAGLLPAVRSRQPLLEELVANRALPDQVLAEAASWADELTCERIAVDQERLLGAPRIVEALYKNPATRMSTVDRLVELCARNGVELEGVATFAAHVEAIRGELIPEPTDAPLMDDVEFAEAVEADSDEEAIERDEKDGGEKIKEDKRPLAIRLRDMSIPGKIRMTVIGNKAALSLLVRDPVRVVALAAISSPKMTDAQAASIAQSKETSEDVLRYIANKREWLGKNYDIKRNLLFNPKTPIGIAMRLLAHLRPNDLKNLARSKNVPSGLRSAANARINKKTRS